MPKELTTGQQAPLFTLEDHHGSQVSLGDLQGKWVILYFYPKDNTPGCTVEAVEFTAALPELKKQNAIVLGISPDSCKSHVQFIDDHKLKVWLLSDSDKKVCNTYGVWREKNMYGRKYMGVHRSTFLIDPQGVIKHIWYGVSVEGHVKEVLDTLQTFHH